ncbi:MAG: penicillin-binding protein 1A [Steroidobacteraceae bacterium]
MSQKLIRLAVLGLFGVTALTLLAAYAIACSYIYLEPSLPSASTMKSIELQVPLRVYSRENKLIAQIGTERRSPVKYDEIPAVVRNAFIAAEDDRFFSHHGFDWQGIARALLVNVVSADFSQGASTITMQAARNLFLTQDRTIRRKLQEIFLTHRLEREFSKQQILGLYLNVIFFGQRSFGVAAAAETYFGKSLKDLTLAEAATLARVPQSPSNYNPITNPQGATERRAYVLRRMRELGFIDAAAAAAAGKEPLNARTHRPIAEVDAPYVAEMVRLEIIKRYGAAAQNAGYRVYTTIKGSLQAAANRALRNGLVEYDQRHGWRGDTPRVELAGNETAEQFDHILEEYTTVGQLTPAVVVSVAEKSVRVYVKESGLQEIGWSGLSWARKYETELRLGPEPKTAGEILARGDVIYTTVDEKGEKLALAQVPEAEAALVAMDPDNGAIVSLVGGFDYFDKGLGKFNRVTQARRQPGSGFKPFLYAAALANDFTPSSIIVDAPIVVESSGEEADWRPENSGGTFGGPMRLREALVRSRNLVSIRILRELGLKAATDYATKFGFARAALPQNLTLALGTLQATPLEMATAYCVFANGGFRVEPYFIDKIEAPSGEIVYRANPTVVCPDCAPNDPKLREARPAERVISPQIAFLMTDIMGDVVKRGTGRRAMALGRNDIAGKTGTTNDSMDTWFNGFNSSLVATAWVGFDQSRSLGESEEGAKTAIPIWLDFMRVALQGVPERRRPVPAGIVQVMISPTTGGPATDDEPGVFEYFRADRLPTLGIMGGEDQGGPFGPALPATPSDPRRPPPPTNDQIF